MPQPSPVGRESGLWTLGTHSPLIQLNLPEEQGKFTCALPRAQSKAGKDRVSWGWGDRWRAEQASSSRLYDQGRAGLSLVLINTKEEISSRGTDTWRQFGFLPFK